MTTKVKFTSPFGVAQYPHISSPDTKGKYADNKFKTKLTFKIDDPAALAMVEAINTAAQALGKGGKGEYVPYTVDEDTGTITLITKTLYAPAIFDGQGNAAKGVMIGGGSVLRVMGNIVPFEKGITVQMNQVQIKELNGFGTCGFDAIDDGYEFTPADASFTTGDTAGSTSPEDTNGASNGAALDI
jgi:hypothetical protein